MILLFLTLLPIIAVNCISPFNGALHDVVSNLERVWKSELQKDAFCDLILANHEGRKMST